ncbi:mycofactocin-coupled SDR family oxidoreductase [Streptomyces mexicanus]|jgi:SDR family mycofactocin-dependent oxidoreductase|uniref:Mycofactocin-coupled SDR family oxidoreductase n=1 Tax=Streptomyces mexicanus TaxID=178566 RepID=A0A7X1LPL7_9ACTN|nr:mycofactocin-coupled SDR family oxidoreductase [Streptomyces mexicanus]MBC2865013.1 mycofactocin-coupled SDR family oxidoreductase [Streptomyces mexicanus]
MGQLDGKVAFITGAARGQGRSHAVLLAEQGADIIGIDVCEDNPYNAYPLGTYEELQETRALVEKAGRRMVALKADVRDFGQVKAAVDKGVEEFGRLDISISNAGIAPMSWAERSEEEDVEIWRAVVDVNLTGAWIAAKAAVPHIQAGGRGGAVVLISSSSGLKGFSGYGGAGGGYGAAKAGLLGLMRSMANALAPESIRVNAVVPTAVNTMMATNEAMTAFINGDPARAKHMANPMPVGMVEPIDISQAVLYLVGDSGRYVTGVALPVDAGFVNK